ncbi:MAG: cell division protein SepF [Clostridia bacterium]|nr:cell division protein SepF [Clostridia bacterium]
MGIFRKFGDWLTDKSNRFIRGEADENMEMGYEEEQAEGEQPARQPLDPFGRGEGEYGGRTPYRSRADLEREAQLQAQQQLQQAQQQVQQMPQNVQMNQQQPVQAQQPQYQQGYQPQSNVVNFPGMQASPDGSVYAHVEYVVLLRSRNECKDVIAYIKSNASVFLNMEFIASDSERQRCVDMLSGAAYTLGCALNKISPRGIYLISSPSVRVVLDPAMQKFTAAPEAQGFARQRYEEGHQQAGYGYQQPDVQPEPTQSAEPVAAGAYTTRFQAQGAQRMPSSFGSVMAGNATGMYQPVAATSRFAAVQQ